MAEKYGNLTLGQVTKLLISIMGRDAALTVANKLDKSIVKKQNIVYKDTNKKFKDLKRLYDESGISFIHLRPEEETSAVKLFNVFLQELEDGYDFPSIVRYFILNVWYVYRDALKGSKKKENNISEAGLIPYDIETSKLSLLLIDWALGYLGCTINKSSVLENSRLLTKTYEDVFATVYKKLKISKSKFCEKVKKFYNEKPLDDFEGSIYKGISKCCKDSTSEPWQKEWAKFKAILDFVKDKKEIELVHQLIGIYLLKNAETALLELCDIDTKYPANVKKIEQIKENVLLWANNKLPLEAEIEKQFFLMIAGKYDPADLSLLQEHAIDPKFMKQRQAIHDCGVYLWGKTSVCFDKTTRLIEVMEKECPHCGIFFASWARGRLAVLCCKFDESAEDNERQQKALKYYHAAFDKGRHFAGAYLKAFLEESIAVTVYFNRRRIQDIPKVIDKDNSLKTPITDDVAENKNREASYGAKQYYEYGYALNIFEQESTETYFLHFHAEEHFWNLFPTSAFVHTALAEQKYSEDCLVTNGMYFIEGGKEGLKQFEKSFKKKLEGISEKSINKRMEPQPNHLIHYSPLTLALKRGYLDIAEDYLERFSKQLDITVINTNGSTALLEALTQYKFHRFGKWDKNNIERYRKIIMELITRSPFDSLYAETKKSYISVLEEAINTFDIEIIKAIVEKKGFDIQNLKISADELSPLYYAVMRLSILKQAISTGNIDTTNANITWKNFNVPGMFAEDKQQYLEALQSDPMYQEMGKHLLPLFIGDSSIWEQEYAEVKEIVKYLLDKTKNVDAFAKADITALGLAAKCDFDDICRLLIEKGANPARLSFRNGMLYDSPLFRAMWYKSWKTLKLLLTDFKDQIKPIIIDKRYMEEGFTAAHLLFKVDYTSHFFQYSINHDNFKHIEHFIPLFRKAGADFNIHDRKGTTVRQILKEKGYAYLMDAD